MKKSLLVIAALAAGFTMSAQQTLVFSEDFEWLAPWAEAGNNAGKACGNTVGSNNSSSDNYAPQIIIPIAEEKTAYEAILDKGYTFEFKYNPGLDTENPDVAIYLQANYLKFNKTGNQDGLGYQCALVLPKLENYPTDGKLDVSFDWCPMVQGSGTYDATQMAVIVRNNGEDVEFTAPEHKWEDGAEMSWTTAQLTIEGVNENSTIIIRNTNAGWAKKTAQRWFIDNIKMYGVVSSGIEGVVVDENAPVEYFNLQGIRVNEPANGLYIRRQGNAVTKVMVK